MITMHIKLISKTVKYAVASDSSQSMFVPFRVERQYFFSRAITRKLAYTVSPCILTDREARHP